MAHPFHIFFCILRLQELYGSKFIVHKGFFSQLLYIARNGNRFDFIVLKSGFPNVPQIFTEYQLFQGIVFKGLFLNDVRQCRKSLNRLQFVVFKSIFLNDAKRGQIDIFRCKAKAVQAAIHKSACSDSIYLHRNFNRIQALLIKGKVADLRYISRRAEGGRNLQRLLFSEITKQLSLFYDVLFVRGLLYHIFEWLFIIYGENDFVSFR